MSSLDDIEMKEIEHLDNAINNYTFNDDSGLERSDIHANTSKSQPIQNQIILINSDDELVPMEWSDDDKSINNNVSFTDLCSTSSDSDCVDTTNTLNPNVDHTLIKTKKNLNRQNQSID